MFHLEFMTLDVGELSEARGEEMALAQNDTITPRP